jgi:hypothetical protein
MAESRAASWARVVYTAPGIMTITTILPRGIAMLLTVSCLFTTACNDDDSEKSSSTAGMMPAGNGAGDGGAAAGDDGGAVDNVGACEDLAAELKCDGGIDVSTALPCSSYGSYACDLAPYFDCVADAWSCDPSQLDPAALMACTGKLTC